MFIQNQTNITPFTSDHGETVFELVGAVAGGAKNYSVAVVELEPDKASLKHYHPVVEECYYILEGQGRMEVDAKSQPVGPGDTIAIPPNAWHQIFNESQQELLKFIVICIPGWTPECSVFEGDQS